MLELLQIIDLLLALITIPALIMMGDKNKWCYPIFLVINFGVMGVVLFGKPILWGVFSRQVIYVLINIRNWKKWEKDDKKDVEKSSDIS
jgi:voltage-gated potassium channel Kch